MVVRSRNVPLRSGIIYLDESRPAPVALITLGDLKSCPHLIGCLSMGKKHGSPFPHEARARHVYVIAGDRDRVKIGVSKNVKRRRTSLQASNPERLSIVHSYTPRTKTAFEVETGVAALLSRRRVSGEWFKCEPKLAIVAIRAVADNNEVEKEFIGLWLDHEDKTDIWLRADEHAQFVRRGRDTVAKHEANAHAEALWAEVKALGGVLQARHPMLYREVHRFNGEPFFRHPAPTPLMGVGR